MISKRITVPLLCLLPLLAVMAVLGALHTPITNAAPDGTQTVTTLADSGAGSLRQAIANATAGDTVEFSVNGTIVLATELVIDKDLTINGGNMITVSGNNATRVFNVANGNVTLDNLTIANGNDQSTDCFDSCGGGVMVQGTLTINDSALSGNSADKGASVYNNGTLVINNSILSNNSALYGGGIYNQNTGFITITNSTLIGNSSYRNDIHEGGNGGGVYNMGVISITHSIFTHNSSYYSGGGIYSNHGTVMINECTFSDNSANNGNGGGVYNGDVMIIKNSVFFNNSADDGGGIYGNSSANGELTMINNSTISSNSATYSSSGIHSYGNVAISDSTITGNMSTFSGSGVTGGGDPAYNHITITNTIISGNTNSSGFYDLSASGTIDVFISGGHNLIGLKSTYITAFVDGVNDDQVGVNNPRLYPLANNGGSTRTHALQSNSPALDAGGNCGTADQRGIARPQGAACDIGAYELIPINFTDFVFLPAVVK